jgi:hypothetical protein
MTCDFALNPETWDMQVLGGKLATVATVPEVAQRLKITLQHEQGEWFLDTTEGLPWYSGILGSKNQPAAELAIRGAIVGMRGVQAVQVFTPLWDAASRSLSVYAQIMTTYAQSAAVKVTMGD